MEEIPELPEGCIANILSRTTPVDACRLSVVSRTFRSASDSDALWNRFLPSDSNFIASIISQSPSLSNAPTKKNLYLALSNHPIIIDNALKSFQLDRKSGKKCYMLAAKSLIIDSGNEFYDLDDDDDDDNYWGWIAMPESRFPEVAKLHFDNWLKIRGMINTFVLSPNTQYVAYLVFKTIYPYGFENQPIELSVGVESGHSGTKIVYLDPNLDCWREKRIVEWHHLLRRSHNKVLRLVRLQRPSVRSDGWLEFEMGEFFNSGLEDEEVHMSVSEIKGDVLMGNLFLEGIEVRPKEGN